MATRPAPLSPPCQASNALDLSLQFGDFAQLAAHRAALPRAAVKQWITHALLRDAELTVRVVGEEEARSQECPGQKDRAGSRRELRQDDTKSGRGRGTSLAPFLFMTR